MRWMNWYEHPGDNRYYVFEFRSAALADEFQGDLESAGIGFERAPLDEEAPLERFGVHRSEFKEALRINHILHGRHRRPFIAHAGLRWAMLGITAAVLGLAIMGWMSS